MILAGFSSLEKSYPPRKVLDGASGAARTGDKIALLGPNGTGKTTLLEILTGLLEPDSGTVDMPGDIRRGYLPQQAVVSGDMTLFEFVLSGFEKLMAIKNRLEEIHRELDRRRNDGKLIEELGELQTQFEHLGGYGMESKARGILTGLDFKEEEFDRGLSDLSGGMQNRAALARLLAGSPDLLLLDEPTNHLDIQGLEFLEGFISGFEGAVIYVSHDRRFIRNTANIVWDLAAGKIISHPGGYDNFLVEREKRIESLRKNYQSQREFIERTEDFIRRNIAGQKTNQARSRRRMLSRLKRLEKPVDDLGSAAIGFGDAGRSSRIVVKCEKVSFSYDNEPFLNDLDFIIERGDSIGLFGPNGSGKTTIIKLILGDISPRTGTIALGRKLSIGYYDQLAENLEQGATPLSVIRECKPEWIEPKIRSYLGRFLFSGDDVFREVGTFSGGEQSRLVLARIIAGEPNFLVLDEPTNHLDIRSREALESAIADFDGTIFCVSHDRQFLDSFAEKIYIVEGGTLKIRLGNYSDYKKSVGERDVESAPRRPRIPRTEAKSPGRPVNPQIIRKVADRIESIEKEISEIESAIGALETSSDWQKIQALLEQRDARYAELDRHYEEFDRLTGGAQNNDCK